MMMNAELITQTAKSNLKLHRLRDEGHTCLRNYNNYWSRSRCNSQTSRQHK